MGVIGLSNREKKKWFRQRHSLLCLLITLLTLAVYGILTVQRYAQLVDRMQDGANLLALRVQEKVSEMKNLSLYLGSLSSVDNLLVNRDPPLSSLSEYADMLPTVAGKDLSIELMLHKSGKILVSDYGMYTYESFLDQAFLSRLREETKANEHWEVRTFQMNIYTGASQVLSYIHSLPLASVQNQGYIIISRQLSVLAAAAAEAAQAGFGAYSVWLEDAIVLASSEDPSRGGAAKTCVSDLEIPVHVRYRMTWPDLLAHILPNIGLSLGIWASAMLLCVLASHLISRRRMERVNRLVQEAGGEWALEDDYRDQTDQFHRILETMMAEITHAREMTRENRPFLQERLIGELLRTRVPVSERRKNLDSCGISLREPWFAVVQASPAEEALDGRSYLLVRRNVLTQLAELGEAYSTYGDGSSILFLLNTRMQDDLSGRLEALCESVHDALRSLLSVEVIFSIGLSTQENPHPHDAYIAARDHMSALRRMDDPPPETVVLTTASQIAHLEAEAVQQVCDAVIARDAAALQSTCDAAMDGYLTEELDLKEAQKRAQIFALRVCAELAEGEYRIHTDSTVTFLRQLQQQKTAAEVAGMVRAWCTSLVEEEKGNREEENQHVEAAVAFIQAHYTRNLSVADIAGQVNVNPIYLNRLFKASRGTTISAYLNAYRCERARGMLEETQATVSEISDACGFSEVRSFIRYFRKYYEETPAEYRRRIRG